VTEEARIQRDGVNLLKTLGWTVYTLSQGYRKAKGGTRMTPGLPDVWAFHGPKRLSLWWEVKPEAEKSRLEKLRTRPGPIPRSLVNDWKRAHAQWQFGQSCRAVGHPYAYGTVADLLTELRRLGFSVGA